jgi:hypothetical protein
MRTIVQRWLFAALVWTIAYPSYAQESPSQSDRSIVTPKAEVRVCPIKKVVRPREDVVLRFEIVNTGNVPFYIPPVVDISTPEGGFKAVVIAPSEARVEYSQGAADFKGDGPRDVVGQVRDHWLLLLPGEFYGGTVSAGIVLSNSGTYKIVGRRDPPRFTEREKELLHRVLKFQVLEVPVESAPIELMVKE